MGMLLRIAIIGALVATTSLFTSAQPNRTIAAPARSQAGASAPITQIDLEGLKALLKPGSKPRLINFWATWCDPCREEFPELVKLDGAYKGKIDFYTVSLDDVEDISTAVPKFLTQMKATMPAYLLHVQDEDAAIATVSKDWQGNLPFKILLKPSGEIAYFREGKIKPDVVTAEIAKLVPAGQ